MEKEVYTRFTYRTYGSNGFGVKSNWRGSPYSIDDQQKPTSFEYAYGSISGDDNERKKSTIPVGTKNHDSEGLTTGKKIGGPAYASHPHLNDHPTGKDDESRNPLASPVRGRHPQADGDGHIEASRLAWFPHLGKPSQQPLHFRSPDHRSHGYDYYHKSNDDYDSDNEGLNHKATSNPIHSDHYAPHPHLKTREHAYATQPPLNDHHKRKDDESRRYPLASPIHSRHPQANGDGRILEARQPARIPFSRKPSQQPLHSHSSDHETRDHDHYHNSDDERDSDNEGLIHKQSSNPMHSDPYNKANTSPSSRWASPPSRPNGLNRPGKVNLPNEPPYKAFQDLNLLKEGVKPKVAPTPYYSTHPNTIGAYDEYPNAKREGHKPNGDPFGNHDNYFDDSPRHSRRHGSPPLPLPSRTFPSHPHSTSPFSGRSEYPGKPIGDSNNNNNTYRNGSEVDGHYPHHPTIKPNGWARSNGPNPVIKEEPDPEWLNRGHIFKPTGNKHGVEVRNYRDYARPTWTPPATRGTPLSGATNDIGKAIELLKEAANVKSSATNAPYYSAPNYRDVPGPREVHNNDNNEIITREPADQQRRYGKFNILGRSTPPNSKEATIDSRDAARRYKGARV